MPKPKIINLNKADRKEIDRLHRIEAVMRYGVETAHTLHFEAGERFWRAIRNLYPELAGEKMVYSNGVLTYTPREKGEMTWMRETKGIEIEEAEEIQVDNFIKELRDRTKELKRLNKEYKEGKVDE